MKKMKRKARLPAYKAGPGDRKAFAEREAEYRKGHTWVIPVDEAPAYAAQKRLFKAPGGLRGDWQTVKKVGPVYVVWSAAASVAAYDYEAETWTLSKDNPVSEAIAALLPPGVGQIWGDLNFVCSVSIRGYAATVAERFKGKDA